MFIPIFILLSQEKVKKNEKQDETDEYNWWNVLAKLWRGKQFLANKSLPINKPYISLGKFK